MTIFVFSTSDHSVICDHACFVFVGTLKKVVTNPAPKFCSRDKPMFAPNNMRCAQQRWIKKRKFHWAMSILSRISFTISNIHRCFSTSTISCKNRNVFDPRCYASTISLHVPHAIHVNLVIASQDQWAKTCSRLQNAETWR